MPSFNLRTLFYIVTIASFVAISLKHTGPWCSFGIAVAMTGLLAVRRFSWLSKSLQYVFASICLALLWLSAVDSSNLMTECQLCHSASYQREIRMVGLPIASDGHRNRPSNVSMLCSDLGVSCNHVFEPSYTGRRHGFILYQQLRCCYYGPPFPVDYDESTRQRVREFTRDNPEAAAKVADSFARRYDWKAAEEFIVKMKANGENAA